MKKFLLLLIAISFYYSSTYSQMTSEYTKGMNYLNQKGCDNSTYALPSMEP